jgi:hypothetical protein
VSSASRSSGSVDDVEVERGLDPLRGRGRDRVQVGDERTRADSLRRCPDVAPDRLGLVGWGNREHHVGADDRFQVWHYLETGIACEPGRPRAAAIQGCQDGRAARDQRGADGAPHRAGADDSHLQGIEFTPDLSLH